MERKRQAAAEVFYCFKTDARCSNKRIGDLLPRYLLEELSPAKVISFEKHLRIVRACGAEVLTPRNLRRPRRKVRLFSGRRKRLQRAVR